MQEDIYQLLFQIAPMVATGIIGWLSGKLRGAAKARSDALRERDDDRAIMRLLLYYRLKDLFKQYVVDRGQITSADKHEVEEVYTYYHDRGGNGEGTRMYREIMELQVNG